MTKVIEGNMVFPDRVKHGQIVIRSGCIDNIILDPGEYQSTIDLRVPDNHFICPGFVDIQRNGGFGKEFKSDIDAIEVIRKRLPEFGTTSFCPTVTTRPLDTYQDHLKNLLGRVGLQPAAKVIGLHLEGPFLNPLKVGAQNAALLHSPTTCPYEEYIGEHVEIVTISPELPGSREFAERLISDGKKMGVGHSLATYEQIIDLFDSENMMIVHAFNAMADLNSRNPGVIGAALEKDDYFVSIIADGIHVNPVNIRILWKSKKDKNKVICITDGSAVSGMDIGIHKIGSRSIEKREDRAVLEGTETLVGSTLTLNVAARNIMDFTACSLSDAINTVSLNPATYLGRENEIGQLKCGNAADIVIINERFDVKQSYIDGNLLWREG